MALRSFADGALFAEVFGEAPPRVLALHGWGRRGADFNKSLDGLPALAPDLPGFGASPPPNDVIGAEGYADLVAEILPEFGAPPVVVGHSFGGRIAICMAARWPERVGPMILTGVPLLRLHPPRKPSLGYRAMRALNRASLLSDDRMESIRRRRGSADYRAATGVMRDILVRVINESYEDQLASVKSATTLLWGERDTEVPVAVAQSALDLLRGSGVDASLEVLDGIGHHVPIEAPDALRRAIDSLP